jgi:hypothetical protein
MRLDKQGFSVHNSGMRYRDDPRDIRNMIRRPIPRRYLHCFGCLGMYRFGEDQKHSDSVPCPCGKTFKRLTASGSELFMAKVAAKHKDKRGAKSYRDWRRMLARMLAMKMHPLPPHEAEKR